MQTSTYGILNIMWVRHGFSCANDVKSMYGKSYNPLVKYAHTTVKDPSLHCIGIKQAEELAKDIDNDKLDIEMICSSTLLRAIETAKIMKDVLIYTAEEKICLLPFITEIGDTDDNKPVKAMENINKLNKIAFMPRDLIKYVDYPASVVNFKKTIPYLCDFIFNNIQMYRYRNIKSKVTRFIEEGQNIKPVTTFEDFYQQYYINNGGVNIIIVSHSAFIKQMTGKTLNNGQIVVQKIDMQTGQTPIGEKEFDIFPDSMLNKPNWSPYRKKYTSVFCDRCKLTEEPSNFWRNEVKYDTSDDFKLYNRGQVTSKADPNVWREYVKVLNKDEEELEKNLGLDYMQKEHDTWWFGKKETAKKSRKKKTEKKSRKQKNSKK